MQEKKQRIGDLYGAIQQVDDQIAPLQIQKEILEEQLAEELRQHPVTAPKPELFTLTSDLAPPWYANRHS